MNLFGVLKYKKMAEDFVRNSGIPFTIIRFVSSINFLWGHHRYIMMSFLQAWKIDWWAIHFVRSKYAS
jgi:hypothetical protein